MKRNLPAVSCLLLFLLLGTSLATAVASPGPEMIQERQHCSYCCYSFTKKPVPPNLVKSCEPTESCCVKPGVVFVTKQNKKICANPEEKWVQNLSDRFNCR